MISLREAYFTTLAPVSPEIIKLAEITAEILDNRFLDSAAGDSLNRVSREFGVERKKAQYASGEVTFTGTPGTVITAGALVASEATQYYTKSDCTIASGGTVTVGVVRRTGNGRQYRSGIYYALTGYIVRRGIGD